jgi:hypothetical protein
MQAKLIGMIRLEDGFDYQPGQSNAEDLSARRSVSLSGAVGHSSPPENVLNGVALALTQSALLVKARLGEWKTYTASSTVLEDVFGGLQTASSKLQPNLERLFLCFQETASHFNDASNPNRITACPSKSSIEPC